MKATSRLKCFSSREREEGREGGGWPAVGMFRDDIHGHKHRELRHLWFSPSW